MQTPPRLIAFCGYKQSGKDTATEALFQLGYQRISFATPIKSMLAALLRDQGMSGPDIYEALSGRDREKPLDELSGRSARHAMQTLGTEWGRDLIDPDLWCAAAMRSVARAPKHARFVIADLRFHNEAAAVRAAGGVIIRLHRPSVERTDEHASEHIVDEITPDASLVNVFDSAAGWRGFVLQQFTTGMIARLFGSPPAIVAG